MYQVWFRFARSNHPWTYGQVVHSAADAWTALMMIRRNLDLACKVTRCSHESQSIPLIVASGNHDRSRCDDAHVRTILIRCSDDTASAPAQEDRDDGRVLHMVRSSEDMCHIAHHGELTADNDA